MLIATCRELARKSAIQGISRSVHCPPLVPKGEQLIELAGGVDRYRDLARGYVVGVWNPRAPTATANGAHWTFSGGQHAAVRVYSHNPRMPAIRPLRAHTTHLAGTAATLFYMPRRGAGFYAGHVGVEWRINGSTFHLTMHGHVNVARVKAMAREMIRQARLCDREASGAGVGCGLLFIPEMRRDHGRHR